MKRTTDNIQQDMSPPGRMLPRYFKSAPSLLLFLVLSLVSACAQVTSTPVKQTPLRTETESIGPDRDAASSARDRIQGAYRDFTIALIALSRGDKEKARQYLESAIREDPHSAYLNKKMAFLLKEQRNYPEALAYARKSVEIDPDDIGGVTLLGDLYALTNNDDLAVREYRKVLALDPQKQRIRLLLTTILVRKKEFQKALDNLDILIGQNPGLVVAHYYRGRINLEMGRYAEAEKAFDEALRLNSALEPALFDLATVYQMTDRDREAARVYEKLLALYPDNIAARERIIPLYSKLGLEQKAAEHVKAIKEHSKPGAPERQALGLIYLRQGKIDKSIEELNLIVNAWPEDDKSRYYLAVAYEEKGDVKKALEHLRRIKEKSSYFVSAQVQIAHLLITEEKYDEAARVLERAISRERDRPDLYLMLASAYETKEEYDKAVAAVKEGLKIDEKNVDLLFRLGVLLDKSGSKEECIEQMKKILQLEPDNADALNYIGYTYAEQGVKLDEAKELIEKALKLKPDSGYIIDSLGWVYYRKGAYDKAISYLERAASLTKDDPTINEHLGDAYLQKKEYRKALLYYEKAVSLDHPKEEVVKEKIIEVKRLLRQEK